MTSTGFVQDISVHTLGSELSTAVAAAAVVLLVEDASDLDEAASSLLRVGGDDPNAELVRVLSVSTPDDDDDLDELDYLDEGSAGISAGYGGAAEWDTDSTDLGPVINPDTDADLDGNLDFGPSTVTLDPTTLLRFAWPSGTRVDVWDAGRGAPAVEWRALVRTDSEVNNDDAIDALVAFPLVPLLPEGVRDGDTAELVTLDDSTGEWVVVNVAGRQPEIQGQLIADGSIPKDSLSFTIGGTTVSISLTPPVNPAEGDIWYDSSRDYQMNAWTVAGGWAPYPFGTAALAVGSITTELIAADAIGAGQIQVGALDAMEIVAGSLTAGTMSAGVLGSSTIDNCAVTDTVMEVDDEGSVLVYTLTGGTVVTLTGSGSWTCPAGVTFAKVECWGAGGGGGPGGTSGTVGGAGGGGGEYASETALRVVPGTVYPYSAGAGGAAGVLGSNNNTGGAGGSSYFDTNYNGSGLPAVYAFGGEGAKGSNAAGGGSGSENTFHYPGGSNGNGGTKYQAGTGGGGSGGYNKAGAPGKQATGPTSPGSGGVARDGGGAGGAGGTNTAVGKNGGAPGGGGGGGGGLTPQNGGAGAAGQIKVTYGGTRTLVASIAGIQGVDQYGNTYYPGVRVYRPDAVGSIGGFYRVMTFTVALTTGNAGSPSGVTTVIDNGVSLFFSDFGICTSGGSFIAPVNGIYSFHVLADNLLTNANSARLSLSRNGNNLARAIYTGGGGGVNTYSVTAPNVWLNAGDTVQINMITQGPNLTVTGTWWIKKEG